MKQVKKNYLGSLKIDKYNSFYFLKSVIIFNIFVKRRHIFVLFKKKIIIDK